MALPSFEVAPVKNTSLTSRGISFRITAAVKVFPWTTRTLRLGCLLTKRVPPPFRASFCKNKFNKYYSRQCFFRHHYAKEYKNREIQGNLRVLIVMISYVPRLFQNFHNSFFSTILGYQSSVVVLKI